MLIRSDHSGSQTCHNDFFLMFLTSELICSIQTLAARLALLARASKPVNTWVIELIPSVESESSQNDFGGCRIVH